MKPDFEFAKRPFINNLSDILSGRAKKEWDEGVSWMNVQILMVV